MRRKVLVVGIFLISCILGANFLYAITLKSSPTASRVNPISSSITILVGTSVTFTVRGNDSDGDLRGAEWYLDGNHQVSHFDMSGYSDTNDWQHTFNSTGDYEVAVVVFDQQSNYSSPVTWNVHVKSNSPPTASRYSPSSQNITITQGTNQTFTVKGTDTDGNLDGVEWYLDGSYQVTYSMSDSTDYDDWSHTFNSTGTYIVEAIVFDQDNAYSSAVAWNVTVNPRERGLYVDGFENILGSVSVENTLLAFAQNNSFDYLALYGLHLVSMGNNLSNFIAKAKNTYEIKEVGACGENNSFFDNVAQFNTNYSNHFDVLNLELEYWNGAASFSEFLNTLQHMRTLADNQGLKIEAYLGWPTQSEAQQIEPLVDRVLLHAYVQSPENTYNYTRTRLEYFASNQQLIEIWPIFSAEDSFMGPWLDSHSLSEAESLYLDDYDSETAPWITYISIGGFQWFTYSLLTHIGIEKVILYPPKDLYISQNFPNPIISGTYIEYSLPKSTNTILSVYDITGKLVKTLLTGNQKAGTYRIYWDSKDNNDKKAPAGIYFYCFEAGNFKATRKLTILR
ncbi:T9SS type A sorting domain-containing protein [candidate division WOR-3 bacterium]|nr:T9SS type A sorting domain-containing protein [candidate division WOR-3 bacterium]